MAKPTKTVNPLQAQLLKAGLVDDRKVKKVNQQQQHAKKTGQADDEVKKALAQAQAEKLAKDQALNQQRQAELEQRSREANIRQMLQQHQILHTQGDVAYQFIDAGKVKKIYVTAQIFEQIVAGHVWIARLEDKYPLLPKPLGEKIDERMPSAIVVKNQKNSDNSDTLAEDDPYAAYVIPDDLMW